MTSQYSPLIKRYLRFSSALSLVFTAIVISILYINLDGFWTVFNLSFVLIHLVLSLVNFTISRQIEHSPNYQSWHFVAAWPLMLSVLLGSPFNFISGMLLILRKVKPFAIYLIFSVLADVTVIFVTILNFFKPTMSPTYKLGLVLLVITLFIHWGLALWSQRLSQLSRPALIVVTALLLLTGLGGNILSFIAAWLLWRENTTKDNERQTSILANISRHEVAIFGLYIITFILAMAVSSALTFEYSYAVENNYSAILQSPSIMYPLGTDNFGRDVFSRMIYGGRISLLVGVLATIVPLVIGGSLGALAGYYSHHIDQTIMRLLDVLYAIPGILLAITIVTAFGTSTQNLILALSIGGIPGYARTMRANVMQVKQLEYVEAAHAVGVSDFKIILKHVIPNASAPMIIRSSMTVATAVISTSSLSYLGLGVESHIPEWGNILRIGSDYLETQPYLAIYPGLAIIALVLSFNFLGDGLRDALDPKMNN